MAFSECLSDWASFRAAPDWPGSCMGKGPTHLPGDTDGPSVLRLLQCHCPGQVLAGDRLPQSALKSALHTHPDQDLITVSFSGFFKFLPDQCTYPFPFVFRLLFLVTYSYHVIAIHQSHRQRALLPREAGRTCCQPEGARSPRATVPCAPCPPLIRRAQSCPASFPAFPMPGGRESLHFRWGGGTAGLTSSCHSPVICSWQSESLGSSPA